MMKKISILCAMRDWRVAQSLARELDDGEHLSISIVSSGDEAYASVCRMRPDILIVDAVLTGMDGLGLIDRLRKKLGDRMPRVIGGTMMPFARQGFIERGANAIVAVPWQKEELRQAIFSQMNAFHEEIDWDAAQEAFLKACSILRELGMHESLKGYTYLAWAAALAHLHEARLCSVGKQLYGPIAGRFETTPQSVERLIRHAVESTMDSVGAETIYAFFGNTIDPMRGKPTNAQILALLVQRMRAE